MDESSCRWKAIACDLDGTLLGWDHKVMERDLAALGRARDAGIHVAICTGRNTIESAGIIGALGLEGLGVFVNGAMVSDMATGKTVQARFVSCDLAQEVMHFFASRGHAVLLLVDDAASRMPLYFMSDHGPPHRSTLDWLLANHMHATLCNEIPAEHRDRLVRLGIIVNVPEARQIGDALEDAFGERTASHSIHSPFYDCQVIELFTAGTSKWSGVEYLARALGCAADEVITIGDDVNDVTMLQRAGLSFAMGNAKPGIQAAAKRVTGPQKECGVAQVIDALLGGELDDLSQFHT